MPKSQGAIRYAWTVRSIRGLAALIASMGILLAMAASASALSLGLQWTGNPGQSPTEMDAVGKSGAALFRIPMNPGQSAQGTDWTYYDSVFGNAAQNGVTILPHFGEGMKGNPTLPNNSIGEEAEWSEWAKQAVRRYGYKGVYWTTHPEIPYRPVIAWEMWNEPNNSSFGTITAAEFGSFVSWAGKAVQTTSESWGEQKTQVLFGGLLAWGAGTNYQTYLKNAYAIGGASLTGVAFHPYLLDPSTFPGKTRLQAFESSVLAARSFINSLSGGSAKSLWITETGWPAEAEYAVGESEQASLLTASFNWAKTNAAALNLQSVIWYNYRDINVPIWQYRSGLRKEGGEYRPSWWAFQAQAGAAPWPGPPTTTGSATGVQEQQAQLNGTVNPVGFTTTFHFEYGTGTDYGRSVPAPEASAGAGGSPIAASTIVGGLKPETVYHYRLVANNVGGTTYGVDQTFKTIGMRYMRGLSSGSGISSWGVSMSMELPFSRTGDVNGDGLADVVAVEPEGSGKYRYKFGLSNGTTITKWSEVLSGMSLPVAMDVGDFNADGKADIVVAEPEGGSYTYRVGFSSGTGVSSWSKVLSGMSLPTAMRVGDFNADGKADIVAIESEGGGKYRYQVGFSGSSGITAWNTVLSGMSLPTAMRVGDFNADGKADIVVAEPEGGSYTYRVGFSSGAGVSSWSSVLSGMSAPEAMAVGDFGGDAKADIVAVEPEGGGKHRYMLGTSSGTGISTWSSVLTGMSRPARMELGDFTGDGNADIIGVEAESGSTFRYMLGTSSGSGVSAWSSVLTGMSYPEATAVANFNADGKADIVSVEVDPGGSYRYKVGFSTGSGVSSWDTVQSWIRDPQMTATGDFNADGKADIVAIESEGGGKYRYQVGFSGSSGITAWNTVLSGMSLPTAMRVGDFNADGKADIVVAEPEGGSYTYRVGFSSGTGVSSWSKVLSGMSLPTAMRVGDFNADGKADIVAIESEGGGKYRYQVGFSGSSGITAWNTVLSGMSLPTAMRVGDFNADGKADIVVAEPEGGSYTYRVGFSSGAGVSSWSKVLSGMSLPTAMRVGDFNADGKADIVAIESEGGGKYRYQVGFSSGSGISTWSKVMSGMSLPNAVEVGDFNADGKADVVALEPEGGSYTYRVGFSSGSGISSWGTVLSGMSIAQKFNLADLNGDGKADLLSVEAS